MTVTTHVLKCWPQYWDAIERNEKRFDVRRDDRGFQKGDIVKLQKYGPTTLTGYHRDGSNRTYDIERKIKYILTGGQLGIEPGYVVLGF
jgi:non-ribosomal peptide synthetase component E (peptide arylation enzyme)